MNNSAPDLSQICFVVVIEQAQVVYLLAIDKLSSRRVQFDCTGTCTTSGKLKVGDINLRQY